MPRKMITIDGNEAVARVAHATNEIIAIYPITPSSQMGETSDELSSKGKTNIWGTIPQVIEMQSEGGASGAVHGALQTGALTTTFTSSQGLLLMIPNMFKIAGELTSTVFHVAARTLATHALSIFGDHADVMSARSTGWGMLSSGSVQEAHDFALIAQAATLAARVPFVHFFEGFRISHEVNKIEELDQDDMRAMIDMDLVQAHRARALTPDRPVLRGTAQNPDTFFQGRETVTPYYQAAPAIVQKAMDKFAKLTGRQYHIMDYVGAPDAERVIVCLGAGANTAGETAKYLNAKGEKVGVVRIRLYRPFPVAEFLKALPASTKAIAVLDRCKEPGAAGEPVYQDVVTAIAEGMGSQSTPFKQMPVIIGGRYGLSSKEFTPGMVKGVFDELKKETPKNHFTIGINDDVSKTSLSYDPSFSILDEKTVQCVFIGLGADGTVGANKNSIKIIGEDTPNYAQGHFYYDSKKSGTMTTSFLRFGPNPINAAYEIEVNTANFVACHQFTFLERFDMLKYARPGGVFLLNSIYSPDQVWDQLPIEAQKDIVAKKLRFYVIDAYEVAKNTGMGQRINTIMQTCFFAISGVLPREEAIAHIKEAIKKTYGKRGDAVVQKNFDAVDQSLANMHEVKPGAVNGKLSRRKPVPDQAPKFVREVLGEIILGNGNDLPVSAFPVDGTYPTATTQWEKRNIALEIPVWDPAVCIQCGKCVMVCPHAVIRQKVYDPALLKDAPASFLSKDATFKQFPGTKYTIAVAPEDCTGCALCVEACPAKNKTVSGRKAINMEAQPPIRERENANWDFFLSLPEADRSLLKINTVKDSQLLQPLFEFSGACAGCGETPYVKLLTQLYGDRAIIANATGCTSIYGGNMPTTPYSVNHEGRGPAWSNSLFEDNAEFGLGMRLTFNKQAQYASELLPQFASVLGDDLITGILNADQSSEHGIKEQRQRVAALKQKLQGNNDPKARDLLSLADSLVKKSVWILGGDGWAYDIGYGGLDHVLASGYNVNVLVLDTEVYSNTGGQASKSTPTGAVAKFAAKGKVLPKKDLGMIAMSYGYVYVARVAMGYSDAQTLKAFLEADAYDGPSIIIANSHCIAHGYDLVKGLEHQAMSVETGLWPLFRYNPTLALEGKNPLQLDSKAPSLPLDKYVYEETRYRMLLQSDEQRSEMLIKKSQEAVQNRWQLYSQMAAMQFGSESQS